MSSYSLLGVTASTVLGLGALTVDLSDKDPFVQHIYSQVNKTIEQSETVPKAHRSNIQAYWNTLVTEEVIEISGIDADIRPSFVTIQGLVEHVLSYELGKSIKSLVGVIHTPTPATPLCNKGTISEGLVDPSIEEDLDRLLTVQARTTVIRDFLEREGKLYVVYPKSGWDKRSQEQQDIYRGELANYPRHLFDRPLTCDSIEMPLIGAFYVIEHVNGSKFAFAIKITQANDPTNPHEIGHFGLWFGKLEGSPVSERIQTVLKTVCAHSEAEIAPNT